ncbi:50S ribosomal protein L11 methyltransferase [Legionella spiritensis]|uniref:50S ribosomal protein L11 methyltransferase n=1 Tax=Legionella spiritensis TaxID=452 RepID=UPI000F6C46BC|nr:50S ribosomal protein L11 methyltransferase [Legionella spiritensis]VEG92181.1 ribosomal protein L11 methyltransferase [Legionella spiritensis]
MWYQLQIEICHGDDVERLSDYLEEAGALSVTLTDKNDDPVLEPEPGTTPLWPDVIIHALYTEKEAADRCLQALSPQYPHLHFTVHALPDQDWERAWMDDFKPRRFGERFWICPSWMEPPEPKAVYLILDPGLAFGTGTHPTTALCLQWLDQADLAHRTMIDYGCGSGILALAALKLGAKHLQAVDIDEQALTATKNNADMNDLSTGQLHIGFPDSLQAGVDILIANILLAPLLTLQKRFKTLLNPEGTLVVSGLLSEQAATLIETYRDDFEHRQTLHQDGWALLIFNRR